MDYIIAIPSYKRTEQICQYTLAVLREYAIPLERIHIWVANEEEEQAYRNALGAEYIIRVGVIGLAPQRNLIERSYPEGTYLVMMDDDIRAIETLGSIEGPRFKPVDDLEHDVFERAFAACEESGARFWGIHAARNFGWMKQRSDKQPIYKGLAYCVGSFFGVIVEHAKTLERQRSHGEDYEYTLRQYEWNGVVRRLDYITVRTKYYSEPGGLQLFRTDEMMEESIRYIAKRFAGLCKMYRRPNGQPELRLRDMRKNKNKR